MAEQREPWSTTLKTLRNQIQEGSRYLSFSSGVSDSIFQQPEHIWSPLLSPSFSSACYIPDQPACHKSLPKVFTGASNLLLFEPYSLLSFPYCDKSNQLNRWSERPRYIIPGFHPYILLFGYPNFNCHQTLLRDKVFFINIFRYGPAL